MVCTDCVCSGAQRAPKAVTGIAVAIQRRETSRFVIARPRRGRGALSAKREEVPLGCNLGKPVTILQEAFPKSGRVLRDCHVASLLAMTIWGQFHFNDALCQSAALRRAGLSPTLQHIFGSLTKSSPAGPLPAGPRCGRGGRYYAGPRRGHRPSCRWGRGR